MLTRRIYFLSVWMSCQRVSGYNTDFDIFYCSELPFEATYEILQQRE
jgi:hypothetical protein